MNRVNKSKKCFPSSYGDSNEIPAVEKALPEVEENITTGPVSPRRDRVELDSSLISRFSAKPGKISAPKTKSSLSPYSVAGCYTRLATASTKGQVQDVMLTAWRSISELRMTSCFGEDEDCAKARVVIASMQKLLQRGNRKIRRLNEEDAVETSQC